jgi:hypothetical protein
MSKKVISFCLWGADPKYCVGAIRNAQLAKKVYPGWEVWVYCGTSVPKEIIDELVENNAKIILKDENEGEWTGTFWRFEAISESEVDIVISRDTDSRLTPREKDAVEEWLSTDKLFHVMRDHPAHSTEILAGMWGAKKPILSDMIYLIKSYTKGNFKQDDQKFLKQVVWPRVAYTTCTHDEFFAKIPFPNIRNNVEFVGQVFDEFDKSCEEFENSLLECLRKK